MIQGDGARASIRRRRTMRLAVSGVAALFVLSAVEAAPRRARADGAWAVVDAIRSGFLPPPGGVVRPVDLAVLPDGGFIVVDDALQRAERFDASGGSVTGYGGAPGGTAAMEAPIGVAVDAARGRAYVSDAVGRKVLSFELGGGWQAAWEGFTQPEAMTIGRDGRLYVYDRQKAALAVRRPDGTAEADITVQRALSFSSELPSGLATSGGGTLFFAAENPVANGANVLYEFTADGDVVPPRTQLRWRIRDLAFDAAGEMFLLDWTNRRVVSRLDRQQGAVGRAWPVAGHPVAMSARAADEVWLLYGASPAAPAAVAVLEGGREVRRMALPRPATPWFGPPLRLQADAQGRLWVVDELERAVRLDRSGRSGDAQFTLHGLQEAVPIGDGAEVVVARTRSSSSADDPDDLDAPPPGVRRVSYEHYPLRPGADPGIDLAAGGARAFETELTASDRIVVVASAVDADGTGAWVLDGGKAELHHIRPAAPDDVTVVTSPILTEHSALGYRDIVALSGGRLGLLHASSRTLTILDDRTFRFEGEVQLEVASARRVAALPGGALAVLTLDDAVAILKADGEVEAVVPLPRPAGAANELATDIAAGPDGTVYVADRLDRAIYVLRVGAAATPEPTPAPALYLPWAGRNGAR